MFGHATDELRAWCWLIRSRTASTLAIAGVLLLGVSLRRAEARKRLFATTTIGASLVWLSRQVAPPVITTAADEATRKHFGD